MSKLIYENKKYLGKLFKKEGTGKRGEWKLYDVTFEKDGDYDLTMSAFQPMNENSIKLDQLEDGKVYNIGYVEEPYDHPEHGTIQRRTLKFISEEKPEEGKKESNNNLPGKKVVLTATEAEVYKKLTIALENSFLDAMKEEANVTEDRAKEIWQQVYLKSLN